MKLAHLYDSLRNDIKSVANFHNVNPYMMDGGKTGLKAMWDLLSIVSKNRAYDDSHPAFSGGHWPRILPFDGRDYCWYYEGGANDDHVATLLRKIKESFK